MSKPNIAIYLDQNNIFFRYKKLDFKKLLESLKEEFNVVKATSYMALDPKQDSQKKFITYLANNGWKCNTTDIDVNTNVDGILITDMCNDYQNSQFDWVLLISGDGDFAYTLDMLAKKGCKIMVSGAKEFVSIELLKVADRIKYIEEYPGIILETK